MKNPSKIRHKYTRVFNRPKEEYAKRYWRRTTMTDEELLKIREELNITPTHDKLRA